MKIYAYLAAVLAFLGYSWGVYHLGGASCREASANEARKHVEQQNELLAKYEDAKRNRERVYVDKIRVVRESTADCLSVDMSDADRMQLPGGSQK